MTLCSVKDIREYMKENYIDNNLDTNHPIKKLGIYKIDKQTDKHWIISMKGPKYSLYEKGVYKIDIKFPEDFPNSKPNVVFINKPKHLQISQGSGRISVSFLCDIWNSSTSISELLVGIYLFFILDQNPYSPFDSELAHKYKTNIYEFNKMVEESILKNCSPTPEDIKLLHKMKNYNSYEKKIELLEETIKEMKAEIIELKSKLSGK